MSTEPTQPLRPPATPEEPEAEAPAAARGTEPPTQAVPRWQAPPPPPPPPPAPAPAPAPAPPRAAPEPARPPRDEAPAAPAQPTPTVLSQAVPASPPPQPTRWERPPDPTRIDKSPQPPSRDQAQGWNQPPAWPATQQLPPGQAASAPPQSPQAGPQPWGQPRAWTEAQPWVEPQDSAPGKQARDGVAGQQQPAPAAWGAAIPAVGQQSPGQPPRTGRRQRKRRVRRSFMALFTVIVLLILLVIGDRVALAVTENEMASQFTQNGFPVKPSVSIEGFPFLTQLAAKDFNTVDVSANNIPVPLPTGGNITIDSVKAKINGMHISSFSSSAKATIDKLNATAFISFGALTAAGGLVGGSGIKVTPDGPDKVKISADVGGIFSDSEEAQITTTGPQTISIKVLPSNSVLGSLLGSFGSFSFNLPKGVPASLRITKLTLNDTGLTVSASATNATFSQ